MSLSICLFVNLYFFELLPVKGMCSYKQLTNSAAHIYAESEASLLAGKAEFNAYPSPTWLELELGLNLETKCVHFCRKIKDKLGLNWAKLSSNWNWDLL